MGIPPFMAYLLAPYVPLEWLAAGLCTVWIVAFDFWILTRVQNLEDAVGAGTNAPGTVRGDRPSGEQRLEQTSHDSMREDMTFGPYSVDRGDALRIKVDCLGEVKAEVLSADGHSIAATNPSSRAERTTHSLIQGRYTVKVTPVPTRDFPTPKHVDIEVTRIANRWHVHTGRMKA